jgi:CubicO group peptidase (beta-lactamase class C family)
MELQMVSTPSDWTRSPAFPNGAAGLLSTVDDYLAFSLLLLNNGVHQGERLLSEESVKLMTANPLTPEQVAGAGPVLAGRGWGFGMAVVVASDELLPVPGRYGWDGGSGTSWFNDPNTSLVAIAMTQTADFLFNGGMAEFGRLAGSS